MAAFLVLLVAGILAFAVPEPPHPVSPAVDGARPLTPDIVRAAWGSWSAPDRYDIWIATPGTPPHLLASMPIEPTLSTPYLSWEDAAHLRYRVRSHGGGATVWRTWRIGLDGQSEELERLETSP